MICFNPLLPKLRDDNPKVVNIQYYLLRRKIEALEKRGVTLPKKKEEKSFYRRLLEWVGLLD